MNRRSIGRGAALLLLVALGSVACGADPGVGPAASSELAPRVQAVRTAAAEGDPALAAEELAALRRAVARLRAAGELDEGEAARVLGASAEVEAELASLTPTTVPSTTSPPPPTATTTTTTPPDAPTSTSDRTKGGKDKPADKANDKTGKAEDGAGGAERGDDEGGDDGDD